VEGKISFEKPKEEIGKDFDTMAEIIRKEITDAVK
jgi:hypothetical protein